MPGTTRLAMDDHRFRTAAAHIAASARRTPADNAQLADHLRSWCWPGGHADHTEPPGRAWVRRWGPACLESIEIECTCAEGRCTLCN